MAEHPNVELMRRGYAAFAAGDMDTVGSLMADDIVWHSPGNNPLSGEFKGKDQVFADFAKLLELTGGTFGQEVHDVVANDQHAVVLVDSKWDKPKPFRVRNVHIWHVSGGKVTEFWAYSEDQPGEDAALTP